MEPKYLTIARSYIGTKEIPGPKHNTIIQGWLSKLKLWWGDDETPWCGVFVAACLQQGGLAYAKDFFRAKAWANFGTSYGSRGNPAQGAIAVLERAGGGHVGFVTGVSEDGMKIRLLGGNQNNMVCEAWFDIMRVIAWRKPNEVESLRCADVAKVGTMSKTEA